MLISDPHLEKNRENFNVACKKTKEDWKKEFWSFSFPYIYVAFFIFLL